MSDRPLLKVADLMQRLNCGKHMVYRLAPEWDFTLRLGHGPRAALRFHPDGFEQWLSEQGGNACRESISEANSTGARGVMTMVRNIENRYEPPTSRLRKSDSPGVSLRAAFGVPHPSPSKTQ